MWMCRGGTEMEELETDKEVVCTWVNCKAAMKPNDEEEECGGCGGSDEDQRSDEFVQREAMPLMTTEGKKKEM